MILDKLIRSSRLVKENVLFMIDLGSTSAKWVTIELNDHRDYQSIDMRVIPWTQTLFHNKAFVAKPVQESLSRSLREIETRFRLTPENRRALVSLPLAAYKTERVTVSSRIEAGHIRQEHKIDLINRARESCKDMIVLHAIPTRYYVNQRVTKDPIGMEATDFAIDFMLVGCEEFIYEEFKQIFNNLKIQVVKYVAPALSFVNYFLSRMNAKTMNPLIFDLGGEVAYLYNIRDGLLGHFLSVPHGSELMTRDVAHVFKTDNATAKRLKEDYVDPERERGEKEGTHTTQLNGAKVDLDMLNDVVYARYVELLKLLDKLPLFDQMREVSTHVILLGQGHPQGAAKWIQQSWHIQVLSSDDETLANRQFVPSLSLVDYCINNDIVLPSLSHRRKTLKHRLFQVVEDLF